MSLFEPYFADPTVLHVGCEAPHAYFIPFDTREGALGDNRNDSSDSRRYGAFAFSDVVGKEIGAFDNKSFWKGFFDFFYRGASPANNKGA